MRSTIRAALVAATLWACAPTVTQLPPPTPPRQTGGAQTAAAPAAPSGTPVTITTAPPGPLAGAFVGEGTIAAVVDDKTVRVTALTVPYANKTFVLRIEDRTLVGGFHAASELKLGEDVAFAFYPDRPLADGSFSLGSLRRSGG